MANNDDASDEQDQQDSSDPLAGTDDTTGTVFQTGSYPIVNMSGAQQPMEIPAGFGTGGGGLNQMIQNGLAGSQNVPAGRNGGWGDLDEYQQQQQQQHMPGSAAVKGRFGGLLSGLAGVLIDGLAAGMAPTSRDAMEMPFKIQQAAAQRQQIQLQQQQMQMQQQKMQAELAQEPARTAAMWAKAKLDWMHGMMANRNLSLQEATDSIGILGRFGDAVMKSGSGVAMGTTKDANLQEAYDMENQAQRQDMHSQFGIVPNLDSDNSVKNYTLVRANPKGSIGQDMDFHWEGIQDIPGQPGSGIAPQTFHFDKNTPIGVMNSVLAKADLSYKHAATARNEYDKQQKALQAQTKQQQTQQQSMANTAVAINSFGRYERTFQQLSAQAQANPLDMEAFKVLSSHESTVASNLFNVPISEVGNMMAKLPGSGYSQRLMKGALEEQMFNQMDDAGKKMVADYSHAIMSNFLYERERMKSSPRNAEVIQAEMANIPKPYLNYGAARPLFGDTRQDMMTYHRMAYGEQAAQQMFQGWQQQPDQGGGATPQQAQSAGGGGQQVQDLGAAPQAAPRPAPAVGAVKKGYRFKGGNPADPNSWERAQ